jgi:ferric-dicitrate binding protein FerR (iron transport regulator)
MTHKLNAKAELERAIAAMKNDAPPATELDAAGDRVLQRLRMEAPAREVESIRSCDDVRALLHDYRTQRLSLARRMIVDDHLLECVECRRYSGSPMSSDLAAAKTPRWETANPADAPSWWTLPRFAAAMAMLLIALTGGFGYQYYNRALSGPQATVQSVDGELYVVSAQGTRLAKAGVELAADESLHTARMSRAFVRLRDGSVVEMNAGAEISVGATRRNTTINLDRGVIIVQAAHRRMGHLYVAAPDCRVAVVGTIFAVDSALKGSRVAVVQGEVRVAQQGAESVLHSGDVFSTSANMGEVSVKREISWSQNFTQYLELLAQFSQVQRKIDQIPNPAPRYSSQILPLVPANTVVYASIPNIGEMLRQANQIFEQQMQQSQVLTDWWQHVNSGSGPQLKDVISKITTLSQYLGDEVVFVATQDSASHRGGPAMLAKVTRSGLREYLDSEAAQLSASGTQSDHGIRVFGPDDLATATVAGPYHQMLALVRPDMLVLSPDMDTLRVINAQLDAGASGFANTPFAQKILAGYSRGAGLLLAADVQHITAYNSANAQIRVRASARIQQHQGDRQAQAHVDHEAHAHAALMQSGFNNLQYIVLERREVGGVPDNRGVFEFSGPRQGVASWLAAPAPMGSLDFISPDAAIAFSAVGKSPALMVDDVLSIASAGNSSFPQHFAEVQAELGLNVRDDLAAALGTDISFALDGPVLPTPSWKLVVEVNDPARLQSAFQKILDAVNRKLAAHGQAPARLDQEQVDSQTFYVLTPSSGIPVHYTFSDGYMIAAPSRALLLGTMRIHQLGTTLAHSANFRALLPADQHANFSALLYQNLSPVLQPLADQLTSEQMQSLQTIAADSRPTVVAAYGDPDSIEFASSSRLFGFDLNLLTLSALVGQAKHGTSGGINP